MGKLVPLDVSSIESNNARFDFCYEHFKKDCIVIANRPQFQGKEMIFDICFAEFKTESFWHTCSFAIHEIPKEIYPCINDIVISLCDDECVQQSSLVTMKNGEDRLKCLYRATRSIWVKEIIDLYNSGDKRIQYWEKENSQKRMRLYLRYQENEHDYVLVFEPASKQRIRFITSFPVFFMSAKADFSKDLNDYKKALAKT